MLRAPLRLYLSPAAPIPVTVVGPLFASIDLGTIEIKYKNLEELFGKKDHGH